MLSSEKRFKGKKMTLKIILFLIIVAILFLAVIFKLIRKNLLPPSSALLWLCIGIIMLSIPLFNKLYHYVAFDMLGFSDATNIVYILCIGFLMLYSLYITVKQKQSSDRIQMLISQLAISEAEFNHRLQKIEKKSKAGKK